MALLTSWKEIASFLNRGVRTVQRWEQKNQLPIHRVGRGDRPPVFAFEVELQNWLRKADVTQIQPMAQPRARALLLDIKQIEHQRRLRVTLHHLLQEHQKKMAELQRTVGDLNKRQAQHILPPRSVSSNFPAGRMRVA